jgi:butyrate response factor 1
MEEYLKEVQEKNRIEEIREQIKNENNYIPKLEKRVNPLRKTSLCDNFEKSGVCPYGDACDFAHGEAELRDKPHRNEIPCRFELMGGCNKPNCDFRHGKAR